MRTVSDRCTNDRFTMSMMPGSVHAMLSGMVVMVLPALCICVGIAIMAYRRRDKFAGRATPWRNRIRR
jgi:hypothetical protein